MSLDPKTIYIAQRTTDGTAWEEKYISGSNLIIQTDAAGDIVGLATLPSGFSVLSSSYSVTASYALNIGQLAASLAGYVVTASGAASNRTASYAMTASYALNAQSIPSGGFVVTASGAASNSTASYAMATLTASHAITSLHALSASYAISASYAMNSPSVSGFVVTASESSTNATAAYAITSKTASYYNIIIIDGGTY